MRIYTGRQLVASLLVALALSWTSPVLADGYVSALKGVEDYRAVYQFSQGNPIAANRVFWAVRDSYRTAEIGTLADGARVVVVFHGPAVKLISTDSAPFNAAEWSAVEDFQDSIRQMKKEGVKFEVCRYAARVSGVDEATILPEVDRVGNGFVSVIGYQLQGYSVVRVP